MNSLYKNQTDQVTKDYCRLCICTLHCKLFARILSRIEIANRCGYITDGRKGNKRRNV